MEQGKRKAQHVVSIEGTSIATPEPFSGNVSDYETLSPVPLSPYDRSTPPDPGYLTPRTPVEAASPISPYVNVALEDIIQAGQMLDAATVVPGEKSAKQQETEKLPSGVELTSIFAHLGTFGVLGVLIRFGLGKLFDDVGHVASTHSALFHDLAANMVGSFFMGWVGYVFKKDIFHFSRHLSLGLSTGLMGSITTFSSWTVKLVILMTKGFWLRGFIGLLIGAELSFMSLLIGMHSAEWFRSFTVKALKPKLTADNLQRQIKGLLVFLLSGLILWTLFLVLTVLDNESLERRTLWLACVLSPPGVWLRWLLSKLNGKGLAGTKFLSWLPWGTLAANMLACLAGFTLSVVDVVADNYHSTLWIAAIQLGTLGCLSTVSTFVVEIFTLGKGEKPWRAYAYVLISISMAFVLGILFYSSVVWARGYHIQV